MSCSLIIIFFLIYKLIFTYQKYLLLLFISAREDKALVSSNHQDMATVPEVHSLSWSFFVS